MLHGSFVRTRNIQQESHVTQLAFPHLRVETSGSHIRPTQEDKKAKEERECFAPFKIDISPFGTLCNSQIHTLKF